MIINQTDVHLKNIQRRKMGRLIDADKLINTFVFHTNLDPDTKEFIEDTINEAETVDAIPLDVEMWMDRFNIQTRMWRTADGEVSKESFIITKAEEV